MKKLVAVLMVLVMVFAIGIASSEKVVPYTGSRVYGWLEEWCRAQGYEEYLGYGAIDDNGYYRGIGVVSNKSFKEQYGTDFNEESAYATLAGVYDGLEMYIKTIGFYEGYEVYKMVAKADEPIGTVNMEGTPVEYCAGEMIFMISED